MKVDKKNKYFILILFIFVVMASILYLNINNRNQVSFTLYIRIPKLFAFILVALCASFSTVTFQTITHNQLLTPSIIGIDSLYVLFQTVIIFVLNQQSTLYTNPLTNFVLSILLTVTTSVSLLLMFFSKFPGRFIILLMVGLVFNTFSDSINTFLQVIMDPNDFSAVLTRTLTSFNQVNTTLLSIAWVTILPFIIYLFLKGKQLDVIHLGQEYAKSLGIRLNRDLVFYLISLSIITATATSLVGPTSFIGFIGANIAYRVFSTYKHHYLFIGSSLIALLFILGGQIIVEHVFETQTTLSVVINFIGGIYFIFLLLNERRNLS